jgi:hypothetical protein
MGTAQVYGAPNGIAEDDPFYTDPASDDELVELLEDAAEIRDTLAAVDTAIDRYQANVARRGRLAGLDEWYDADDQVVFLDDADQVIDSFIVGERREHLEEAAERLRDEITIGIDRLESWHPEYGVDGALQQLYGTARMTMGEGRVDADQLDRVKDAAPDAFFTLLQESSAGTYNQYEPQLLDRYITTDGSTEDDGRYGILAAVAAGGCMTLEEAFADDAEQERAYIHVLHENYERAVNGTEEAVTAPTAFRVEKIRTINDLGEDAYTADADRMFQ